MPECENDNNYVHPSDPELTCKKIRNREYRRQSFCTEEEVNRLCPQSCGVCCKNDSTYTFMHGSVERNCTWVGNLIQSRKKIWCGKHKGGHIIKNMCPVACDECKSYISIVSSSPSSWLSLYPSYLPSSGPSLYPSFDPTHDPSSSPSQSTLLPILNPTSLPSSIPRISPTAGRRQSIISAGGMTTYKIAHTNEVKEIVWICLSVVVIAIGVIGYVSYHIIRLRSESKPDREDEAQ